MDAGEIKQLRKAVLELTKCVINLQGAVLLLARDHRGPAYLLICEELEAAAKAMSEALKALE